MSGQSDDAARAELLDLLLLATQDGIVDWNLQTGETVYNPRWKHLFGFDSAEQAEYHETPDSWRELIHPDDLSRALRLIDDHVQQGWPLYTTVRMRHRHVPYKHILLRGATHRDQHDHALRVVLVFSDVDERIREEQRQREELAQAQKIVAALSSFSQPDGDRPVPTDLQALLENTLLIATNEWQSVADFELQLSPGLPPVPCLGGALNQVVLDLIVNAAHAIAEVVGSSGKKGKISISAETDATHAVISITDTAARSPERAREKLASAHDCIVRRHHGNIDFQTQLGAGTTFIIRLPLAAAEHAPSGVSP